MLDFGLAKHVGRKQDLDEAPATRTMLTASNQVVGTMAYMSPEQAQNQELDERTDLFSLGTVLYEMCTGRRPFSSASDAGLYGAILHDDPAPPSTANPAIPAELESAILKALEKDRTVRY